MLACKRGHERVVSVLVSMGAEVCMKDCRNRAAKDTAERRHHVNLLPFLDTQVIINSYLFIFRIIFILLKMT